MSGHDERQDRWSMLSALLGTALILATLVLAWARLEAIGDRADRTYAQRVLVRLELEGLENERLALEGVVRQARQSGGTAEVAGVRYTAAEIARLENDLRRLRDVIAVKRRSLNALERARATLLLDFQLLFWGSLFAMLVGVIAAVLGYLSWFRKVKIFRDRRRGPRREDLEAFREARQG